MQYKPILNLKINIMLDTIILILLICGCSPIASVNQTNYRMTNNIMLYKKGLESLCDTLEKSEKPEYRQYAAREIGEYSKNKNRWAREVLLENGVSSLIRAIENEPDALVRIIIIESLGKINPEDELVIDVYVKAFEKGVDTEKLSALMLLKRNNYNLHIYVEEIESKLGSEQFYEKDYAIKALGIMGTYAYGSIEKLNFIMINDENLYFRNLAKSAIDKIIEDKEII